MSEGRDNQKARLIGALRVGDVRKALQLFVAAPIAPKTEETLLSQTTPPSLATSGAP